MIDPRSLAERREEIVLSCTRRGYEADVDGAIAAYEAVALARQEVNEANRLRNEHQKAGKRKLEPDEREAHNAEGRRLKDVMAEHENRERELQAELDRHLMSLPNFVHPDSPVGGEENFRVLREVGEKPSFDFPVLDHLQLAEKLDLVDFESGAKVAGQKFYYLKNEAALLEMALHRFAVDVLLAEGFTLYTTPDLARPEILDGIGYNPRGPETQVYSIEGHDLCLIGTAEITLGGIHMDSILDEDALPLKLAGLSHCFRTEAGAHGRESKGLYRVHHFSKVEMFVFTTPEDSERAHQELVDIEEKIFQALEIPYRVIDIPTGDLGAPAYRKFDLEAWMPGRGDGGEWGEITSASNCTDFQARRLKIRVRRAGSKKNEIAHTLNGTAVSCARAILAFMENHQRADGSIGIPKALQPYMGRDAIGPR